MKNTNKSSDSVTAASWSWMEDSTRLDSTGQMMRRGVVYEEQHQQQQQQQRQLVKLLHRQIPPPHFPMASTCISVAPSQRPPITMKTNYVLIDRLAEAAAAGMDLAASGGTGGFLWCCCPRCCSPSSL